jgi:hypothetical protein
VALPAEHIPKHHRVGFAFEIIDLKLLRALEDLRIISARLTEASQVAFHVRHEYRHATRAEILRKRLQGDCFSRARGACDQAMAVRHFWKQINWFF